MQLTDAIRSSSARFQDAYSIFGPNGRLDAQYQPDTCDLEDDVTEWVQGLWDRRVSRLKDSRWNTRWAGLFS